MDDRLVDHSQKHDEARLKMRRMLLDLKVPTAKDLRRQYYETITLAEHEAARRVLCTE